MRHNWTLRRRAGRERAHPTAGRGPAPGRGWQWPWRPAWSIAAFAAVEPTPPPRARLSAISAKASVRGASVRIEASEPVAYVTTRPDPLTVLVDLRNVTRGRRVEPRRGVAPSGPIAGGHASRTPRAADGAAVARVRVLLAAPAQHQVHSERNLIQVDVRPTTTRRRPSSWPASPRPRPTIKLRRPRRGAPQRGHAARGGPHQRRAAGRRGDAGGQRRAGGERRELADGAPHRLVLDFAGVAPARAGGGPVGKGAVRTGARGALTARSRW